MPDLKTKYLGLELKNPIVVASCGFTDSVEKIKDLEKNGAAAVVLKSIFEEEILREAEKEASEMMQNHEMRETFDYIDHYLKGARLNKYTDLITKAKKETNIPIIASINCVSNHEWTYFANNIETAGADALELNIFILPSDPNKTASDIEKLYMDIIKSVKEKVNIPVAVKISYYFSDLANMTKRISASGISGIVMFNRSYSPDFDIDEHTIVSTNVLSNSEELLLPLRWVALLSDGLDCSIAASTGVHTAKDAIKMFLAGADIVQIASTLYNNGTEQIQNMLKDIEKWMEKHNYNQMSDFRGKLSQKNIENPHVWERVQFMKYFSEIK